MLIEVICKCQQVYLMIEMAAFVSIQSQHHYQSLICIYTVNAYCSTQFLEYIKIVIIIYYSDFILLYIAAFCRYSLSLVASITFALPVQYVPAFSFMSTLHSYNSQESHLSPLATCSFQLSSRNSSYNLPFIDVTGSL